VTPPEQAPPGQPLPPLGAAPDPATRPPAPQGPLVRTRGTVVIDREACKGCDLCIEACPPRVLRMTTSDLNERGYRYPVLVEGCTACKACSQICPDFVFQVYKYDEPLDRRLPLDEGSPAGGEVAGP
jgi:2-oxoglutarate ferredoxin oxidoreductase subunit delta